MDKRSPAAPPQLFASGFDLIGALACTKVRGYCFAAGALGPSWCDALRVEVDQLSLEVGDHVRRPINAGTPREVQQLHARAYHMVDSGLVPVAQQLAEALGRECRQLLGELRDWTLREAGYQFYRQETGDWISPHRDRRDDRFLSITATICGVADVLIHEPTKHPDDYRYLRQVDSFTTGPGTLMFLRAPGLGSGEQVVHEVCTPQSTERLVLNMRDRSALLKTPFEFGDRGERAFIAQRHR